VIDSVDRISLAVQERGGEVPKLEELTAASARHGAHSIQSRVRSGG